MGINQELIKKVTSSQIRSDLPKFVVGDTIKVHVKIKEGTKERIQMFEGVVLRIRGEGISRTFTVRKISSSTAVERIFVLNSPLIADIDIIKTGYVRQSRIYYMRDRSGKSARIKPRQEKVKVTDKPATKKAAAKPTEKKVEAKPVAKKVESKPETK